jgi:hypothetical protein
MSSAMSAATAGPADKQFLAEQRAVWSSLPISLAATGSTPLVAIDGRRSGWLEVAIETVQSGVGGVLVVRPGARSTRTAARYVAPPRERGLRGPQQPRPHRQRQPRHDRRCPHLCAVNDSSAVCATGGTWRNGRGAPSGALRRHGKPGTSNASGESVQPSWYESALRASWRRLHRAVTSGEQPGDLLDLAAEVELVTSVAKDW